MTPKSLLEQSLGFVIWLVITFSAAAVGSVATMNARDFYSQLVLPAWAPPGWVFGPVWTLLYAMMAVAAWLVWRVGGFRAARGALCLFLIQLAFNALWSWLFFAWNRGALAFLEIWLLWLLILATLLAFWRVRAAAGWLLVPYLLWVSFAAVLSHAIWQLNPSILG